MFLQKSYSEYSKVEKPVLVTMSYDGSDEEEELKMVPIVIQNNNNYNVVSDLDNGSNDENKETLLDENINEEVKMTPTTLSKLKWFMQ